MTNRTVLLALAAMLAAFVGPAAATSIATPPPHNPARVCSAIGGLVADINAGDPLGAERGDFREFHTDALGRVNQDELPALTKSLRKANGKADRAPMRIFGVWPLKVQADAAFYIVTLERETWQLERIETDEMLMPYGVPDPHWGSSLSTWLVGFASNHIVTVREADELDGLTDLDQGMKGCGRM